MTFISVLAVLILCTAWGRNFDLLFIEIRHKMWDRHLVFDLIWSFLTFLAIFWVAFVLFS